MYEEPKGAFECKRSLPTHFGRQFVEEAVEGAPSKDFQQAVPRTGCF